MFGFKKTSSHDDASANNPPADPLDKGLARTRQGLFSRLRSLLSSETEVNATTLDELEDQLLSADLGITVTTELVDSLRRQVKKKQVLTAEQLLATLKAQMIELLRTVHLPLQIDAGSNPFLLMMIGVNGVGKTTTIGKLAKLFQQQGLSVMLAAGDTFRAAAIEQLQTWGERNQVPVISQSSGSDSAAVIFDALGSARAQKKHVLIADTAGRLHTKQNLMQELAKVSRVVDKFDPSLKKEILLVLDATTGQNALVQAREFHQSIGITGIVLTKLDGTAKGGIVFALARELGLPIRYIGVGEQLDDLRPFDPEAFVNALLNAPA